MVSLLDLNEFSNERWSMPFVVLRNSDPSLFFLLFFRNTKTNFWCGKPSANFQWVSLILLFNFINFPLPLLTYCNVWRVSGALILTYPLDWVSCAIIMNITLWCYFLRNYSLMMMIDHSNFPFFEDMRCWIRTRSGFRRPRRSWKTLASKRIGST